MISVPIHRAHDHKKIALSRCCGVCRFFVGASIVGAGDCTRHNRATSGRTSAAKCEQWARRREGVDPLPWGIKADVAKAIEAALEVTAAEIRDEVAPPRPAKPAAPVKPRPAAVTASNVTIEHRRERLRQLVALRGPVTAKEASDELRLPAWKIRNDAEAIEIKLAPAPSRYDPKIPQLRERVRQAFDGTRTIRQIAEIVGANVRTVSDHLSALKLKPPRSRPGPAPRVKERQEKVRELVFEGKHSRDEIASIVGVSRRTLVNDFEALGPVPLEVFLPPLAIAAPWAETAPPAPTDDILARAADMIRIARNTSAALNALAGELEEWLERSKG